MAALNTNILVRHLVHDDAAQSAAAQRLIARCIAQGHPLFIPVTVVLELEWVLRSAFGFDKGAVTQTLAQLLSAAELAFESETSVECALALYQSSAADFSDCVHTALAAQAGEQPLWTFDKRAARLDGAALLTA